MNRLVIFDLDGTLLNTIDDLAASTNMALAAFSLPGHDTAAYKRMVGSGADALIRRAMPRGLADQDPALFSRVREGFDRFYALHSHDKTAPYPGISALLQRCSDAGVMTAVLSNKPHGMAVEVVRRYFPDGGFTLVLGQRPGMLCKPDPTGVFEIIRSAGARPEESLFVGDSDVDMETARNSGLRGVGVLWGFRTKSELESAGAWAICAETEDLCKIILTGR
ncbi:MAG: HAD family hydrolase [Oscillospiraceae bacterium]|nr:HAD family hydrolase [Oscillospiraceae bacterium]